MCIVYGSYDFLVPKPCRRIGTVAIALSRQSCADVSLTVAMALRTKAVWRYRTVAKAVTRQTVRTYRTIAKASRAKAVRTVAKAVSRQSCADVSRR